MFITELLTALLTKGKSIETRNIARSGEAKVVVKVTFTCKMLPRVLHMNARPMATAPKTSPDVKIINKTVLFSSDMWSGLKVKLSYQEDEPRQASYLLKETLPTASCGWRLPRPPMPGRSGLKTSCWIYYKKK